MFLSRILQTLLLWCTAVAYSQASDVDAVEFFYTGLFNAKVSERRLNFDVVSNLKSLDATTDIPARIGVTFGTVYQLQGRKNRTVTVTEVFKYPGDGIVLDGEKLTSQAVPRRVKIGESTFAGYGFDEEGELAIGEWEFEIWFKGEKLASRTFNIQLEDQMGLPKTTDGKISEDCEKTRKTGSHLDQLDCQPVVN